MPSLHLNRQIHLWCGVQNGKKLLGLYKEIIFMNIYIQFLDIEWRTPYPLTNLEDHFGLCASVTFFTPICVVCCSFVHKLAPKP